MSSEYCTSTLKRVYAYCDVSHTFFCQMSGAVRENWKVKISCHSTDWRAILFFPCTNDNGWKKQLVDIFYRWKFRAPLILIPKLYYALYTLAKLGQFWNWNYRSRINNLEFRSILDFCQKISVFFVWKYRWVRLYWNHQFITHTYLILKNISASLLATLGW